MTEQKFKVRAFLSSFFSSDGWSDEDDMFQLGFVNSLMAMQLVLFVEKEFKIVVEDEDLEVKNFCSVNAICELVQRKIEAVPGITVTPSLAACEQAI